MLVYLIIAIILIISTYFSIFKPIHFTIFYGLIGSEYDSRGIVEYFQTKFGYYVYIMQFLLFLTTMISVLKYIKNNNSNSYKHIKKYLTFSVVFILWVILSVIISDIKYIYDGNLYYRILICVIVYCPSILIIWFINIKYYNHKKIYIKFVLIQTFFAYLITYLPIYGIKFIDVLDGSNYVPFSEQYRLSNTLSRFYNFYEIFLKKGRFVRMAQFQNANGLGFYSGICLAISLYMIFSKNKISEKFVYIIMTIISFLLWTNAGTRGVIYGIIIGIFMYILKLKNLNSKFILISSFGFFFIIVIFLFQNSNIFSYFFSSGAENSVIVRNKLMNMGFEYLKSNLLFGNGGVSKNLTSQGIDPHLLPLKIGVLFGIIPAIIVTIIVFIMPILKVFSLKKISLYSLILISIIWTIAITNYYTCFVLFWLTFCEFILEVYEEGSNIVKVNKLVVN